MISSTFPTSPSSFARLTAPPVLSVPVPVTRVTPVKQGSWEEPQVLVEVDVPV